MLKFHELEGKVKEYTTYYYEGRGENNEWTYDEDDYNIATKFIFDEEGRLLEQVNYSPEDTAAIYRQQFFYKSSGKFDYSLMDGDNLFQSSKGVYVYLDNERIKEIILYNDQEEVMGKTIYEYQADQWIASTTINEEKIDTSEFFYQQYVYSLEGSLLSYEFKIPKQNFHQATQQIYREGEKLTYQSIAKDYIDNTEKKFTYRYEFDQQGNWIKRYEFSDNPSAYPQIFVRKIEYFD